ncbi:MAG: sulfite exporter TauE/SafE family protein [Oscillospiraceae bacterium]|jgi:uncharacterized membrane protein YfcA|nr:sulfite exporter TauE/SafE family protein [Oscillospiraceae bacterium]
MNASQRIKCAIAGILAGAANGFFGAGGGMFIIPLYTRWVRLEEKRAYACSVAAMLPICAVSAAVYLLRGGMDISEASPYIIGGALGGIIGGRVFDKIPASLLRRAFAILLICGGVRSVIR